MMKLVVAISNHNVLANTANEMLTIGGDLNKQVGIALRELGYKSISEVKEELKKYTNEKIY